METKSGSLFSKIILIALIFFVFVFVFLVYTFLHEAGHALTGLAFGQTLTEFNINFWNFDAHVSMAGSLSQAQRAFQSVAGAGLPLSIWFVLISLAPRKASYSIEALKLIASMAVLNTLLAWIMLPILYLVGQAPSDDVTNFIRYSQISPFLLLVLALSLYIAGWRLFLAKIDGLRNELLLFTQTDMAVLTSGMRTAIPTMTSLMLACMLLTYTANLVADKNPLNRFSPPQDFQSVTQINLASRAYETETLARFSLKESAYVGVFVAVRNIDTRYFDLSMSGPDGFNEIILHGEGYRAEQDGGLWEKNLPPGEYKLVMTSRQNPGTVSVYLQIP